MNGILKEDIRMDFDPKEISVKINNDRAIIYDKTSLFDKQE